MGTILMAPQTFTPALCTLAGNPNVCEAEIFQRRLNNIITELALKET